MAVVAYDLWGELGNRAPAAPGARFQLEKDVSFLYCMAAVYLLPRPLPRLPGTAQVLVWSGLVVTVLVARHVRTLLVRRRRPAEDTRAPESSND